MFTNFRQYVKSELKSRGMTYATLSRMANVAENTIKCFMCGRDDSRRIAEKIADALGISLIYSNQTYEVNNKEEN